VTGLVTPNGLGNRCTPDEQLQLAGIDMASIATAAAELVGADPD
jgi:hypothetical protein